MPSLTERETQLRITLRDNFEPYGRACLKIRSKSGAIFPFHLNKAQQYIHARVEEQRRLTGKVRAICLKGRQQGCSTYIQGRLYWRITHKRGQRAFILTHESEATGNLFDMTNRFHENCPQMFRPHTSAASANELMFDILDCGYKVGTAGNKAVGRSATIQFFHGSEVAYWPNAEEHASGILQAVPNERDTEIWLESTANGPGDFFHTMWRNAVAGENGFIPIFVPWFWQPEYRLVGEIIIANDEKMLAAQHGLDNEQLLWRRNKIRELGGGDVGLKRFHHEYPCTPEEAFEESGDDKIIPAEFIRPSVGRNIKPVMLYKSIWGVDVGWQRDTSALAKRRVNVLTEKIKSQSGKDPMQVAGWIKAEWDATPIIDRPSAICVDVIGIGAGVVARLREHKLPVIGVNVAETKGVQQRFKRLKDQLWWRAREWFESNEVVLPADCDLLIQELSTPGYSHTSAGEIETESKDELKARGVPSHNEADAFIHTFYSPYEEALAAVSEQEYIVGGSTYQMGWMGS